MSEGVTTIPLLMSDHVFSTGHSDVEMKKHTGNNSPRVQSQCAELSYYIRESFNIRCMAKDIISRKAYQGKNSNSSNQESGSSGQYSTNKPKE